MNLSNASRSVLAKIPGLNEAIDFICARANLVFSVQHDNETGSHHDLTVTSGGATIVGDVVVTDVPGGSATGVGTFDGNVTADADGSAVVIGTTLGTSAGTEGAIGPGIDAGATEGGSGEGPRFAWLSFYSTYPYLRLLWRTSSDAMVPLQIRYEAGDTSFRVMPGAVTNALFPCMLGSDTDSFSAGRWTKIFGQIIDASTGYLERGRTAYVGEWTAVSYSAGNFTASAGAWTVDSGDQIVYRYMLIGKTMFLRWQIITFDVTVGGVLRLAIPGGFTAAGKMDGVHRAVDTGAAAVPGICRVLASGTYVEIFATMAGGNYGATAGDDSQTVGGLDFEVA